MKRVLVLCAVVLSGCATSTQVVPVGQDTYKISVATDKIPVTTVELPTANDTSPQIRRVLDTGAADTRARKRASEYCTKLKKTLVVKNLTFDMGPGYALTFSCVTPQGNAEAQAH